VACRLHGVISQKIVLFITTAVRTPDFKFFIYSYLRAELNSQWPVTESARIQTTTAIRQHGTKQTTKQIKMDELRLFIFKHDLLKISVDLQTAFAADTHLAEGQWLKELLNVVKLRMFRVGICKMGDTLATPHVDY
jgi:hypothetical protein